MKYSNKEIIDTINRSEVLNKVIGLKQSNVKLQQGILGNLEKISLEFLDDHKKPYHAIYKNQLCSDKLRETIVYDLLFDHGYKQIPLKICNFDNGDIIIESLDSCKSKSIIRGCSPEQAKNVVESISTIHSTFWNNKNIPCDSYSDFAGILKYNLEENMDAYFKRYSELLGDSSQDFDWLQNNPETVSKILNSGKTLTHGDLHLENIMFSESDKIYFIDWQLASKRTPAFDISFFLIQNLDEKIRRKFEKELLFKYYTKLATKIKKEYSFELFSLEYRACLTRSMMTSVMMIGSRFAHKDSQMNDADIMAQRVITAVKDLKPIEAIKELSLEKR